MLNTSNAEVDLNGLEGQTKIVTPTLYTWILRFAVGWDYFDGGLRKAVLAPQKLAVGTPTFVLNKLVSFLPHPVFVIKCIISVDNELTVAYIINSSKNPEYEKYR